MEKIYTITFSPAIDYFMECDNLELWKINRTDGNESLSPGGKGINISLMLENLGYSSIALGFVAGFTGEAIEEMVKERGVKTDFIHVDGLSRINVKLRSSNKETEINGHGPLVTQEAIDKLLKKLDALEEDDYLVLAGTVPKNFPAGAFESILKCVEKKGVRLIVDTSTDLLKIALPYEPFLIKPNLDEVAKFFGSKLDGKTAVSRAAKKLHEMGAENVVISMGEKGAYLLDDEEQEYWIAAPKGEVVNTIGSGDSLVAGFIAGRLTYGNLSRHALRLGVAAGSASAFKRGLAEKDEVEKLLKELS